jgi:hypothetical protein
VYNFNEEWDKNYLFIKVNNKCVYLKSNSSIAASNKCNVERHFMTMHKDYISDYPGNSEMHGNKLKDLYVIYVLVKQHF